MKVLVKAMCLRVLFLFVITVTGVVGSRGAARPVVEFDDVTKRELLGPTEATRDAIQNAWAHVPPRSNPIQSWLQTLVPPFGVPDTTMKLKGWGQKRWVRETTMKDRIEALAALGDMKLKGEPNATANQIAADLNREEIDVTLHAKPNALSYNGSVGQSPGGSPIREIAYFVNKLGSYVDHMVLKSDRQFTDDDSHHVSPGGLQAAASILAWAGRTDSGGAAYGALFMACCPDRYVLTPAEGETKKTHIDIRWDYGCLGVTTTTTTAMMIQDAAKLEEGKGTAVTGTVVMTGTLSSRQELGVASVILKFSS